MSLSLKEACDALDKARDAHKLAQSKADSANKDANTALNTLNQAQKEFDIAAAEVRKNSSPWNSHWHQKTGGPIQS